jgi:hypothetical protein
MLTSRPAMARGGVMRSLWITLTAGALVLLLSGCPDLPGGRAPAQSDMRFQPSRSRHAQHENAAHPSVGEPTAHGDAHHSVGGIAWFQGTIDEAFSRRGCSESEPRRTLFRF